MFQHGGHLLKDFGVAVLADAIAPYPTITSDAVATVYAPLDVTITFSEPVFGFAVGDITVTNGSAGSFVGSDGDSVYTATITPTASGTVTVGIAAGVCQDAAGNLNSAAVDLTRVYAIVYGVSWYGGSSPTLTRTDQSVGFTAQAGVDAGVVTNDFDAAEIYGAITEVTDGYGNVFVRIPKFYIEKTAVGAARTWRISKVNFSASCYLPRCFWDYTNNVELDYIDVGKYLGSVSGGKLQSQPGEYPAINTTIVNFRTYARANGAGYQLLDVHVVDMLQALFYVEFATLDTQSIMAGYTTGRYTNVDLATASEAGANRIIVANASAAYYAIGQAISVGTSQGGNQIFYGRTITDIVVYDGSNMAIEFDGDPVDITTGNYLYNTGWRNDFSGWIAASSGSLVSNSSGKYPCSYRGIENPWGNVWQFVDGVNINDNQAWVALDADNYVSNLFAAPYQQLSYVNSNTNGYVERTGHDANYPFANLPVQVGSPLYYSDYYYQDAGQRIALLGGHWYNGSGGGLSCWSLSSSSSSADLRLGARLLRKAL